MRAAGPAPAIRLRPVGYPLRSLSAIEHGGKGRDAAIPDNPARIQAARTAHRSPMGDFEDKPNLLHKLAGAAIYRHVWLVQRSSRWLPHLAEVEGRRQARRLTSNHPFIFAVWHGQFMLVPLFTFPKYPTKVMVARHGDAAIASELLKHFGIELIRGAGAGGRQKDRGGAHAIRASIEALRKGVSVALTADVPPGPARRAGMGIIMLARVTGRPIVPVAVASSRYISLPTWSRMTINLPWSKCASVVGDPVAVPSNASPALMEQLRQQLEDTMNAATREAYARAGAADPLLAAQARAATAKSPMLSAYRAVTKAVQPAVPALLAYRVSKGKEDAARTSERLGHAGRPRPPGPLIWLHAASVGETAAVGQLIGELKARRPSATILLTTGTVTSASLASSRFGASVIHQYAPLDGPGIVARFLDHWRPQLGLLVESEIWPNLILAATERKIPLALLNARISDASFRGWQRRASMSRKLFGTFAVILAQTEVLSRRFTRLGGSDVRIAGNLKYDAAPLPVDPAAATALRAAIGDREVFVAASTHPGEEAMLGQAVQRLKAGWPRLLTILAPRHPERGQRVAEELRSFHLTAVQRSGGRLPGPADDVYVADTLGELGLFYANAPLAYIGGSLVPHGGQNPIEAIQLGAGVVSGPHWQNFDEIYQSLLRKDGCRRVTDPGELASTVGDLLGDAPKLAAMRKNARDVVAGLSGALQKTLAAIEPLLPPAEPSIEAARAT